MDKKDVMKKRKVKVKRPEVEIVNVIDTSNQLDLPFANTTLNHDINSPREQYSNLISAIETASIFSCKPSKEYPKYDYRNYSDQVIKVRENKEGIRSILISAGKSNTYLSDTKIETEYSFLDFNDELVFSIIVKLIAIEKMAIEAGTEDNTLDEKSERVYSLVTSFRQIIDETAKLGKQIKFPVLKKSLQKLQSTVLEVEYEDHTRIVSMIDRFNIKKATRPRDSKLIIQVSGLTADAIEEAHSYYTYNHLTTYTAKNQIAVWLKKEMMTYHRNLRLDKAIILNLADIYRNSNHFDLSSPNYVNKQKLERSLKYVVERKVTISEIEKLYKDQKIDVQPWEVDKFKQIENSPSLLLSMPKINDLMNYRRNFPNLVEQLSLLFDEFQQESRLKIFQSARFCKIGGNACIEFFPNETLVHEIKAINYSIGQRNKR